LSIYLSFLVFEIFWYLNFFI